MDSAASRPRPEATYEDLLALPDHLVGQIIDGELFALPRPASPHANAATVLGSDLNPAFQRGRGGPGGSWVLNAPEVHFGKHVLVPDLAGWRRERLPVLPRVKFFTLAPDWVCEVLSPSTVRIDRIRKLRIYAEQGIGHAWLVDPEAETLEVFRLEGEHWVLIQTFEGITAFRAEPFEAVELQLGDLWLPEEESSPPQGAEPT